MDQDPASTPPAEIRPLQRWLQPVDDLYLLARGYAVGISLGWIVLHAVIMGTGLLALRRAGLLPRRDARRAPSEVEA